MIRPAVVVLSIFLVGCASTPPAYWMLYAHTSYSYGRLEALAEQHCRAPVPANRADMCREAARVQAEVQALKPQLEAALSKSKPDWATISKYMDLILGAAGKFLVVP